MALDDEKRASRKDASENWDDDFEFQSNAPSPTSARHDPIPTSSHIITRAEESWDDAYEDEGDVHERDEVAPRRESDVDTASWGSDSEWSGDGDAEDTQSYTHASSEPPESPSPAQISTRFPIHTAPATRSPSSPSFFSRISPVKKWKARETPLDTKKKGGKWPRGRDPTRPAEIVDSQRKGVVPVKFPHAQSRDDATRVPTSPLTPDLTFSASAAPSPVLTPPPPPSRLQKSSRPAVHPLPSMLAPAPLPLLTASTHNLPSTVIAAPPTGLATPRRSSLGDLKRPGQLKIPDRISRAQHYIKRDMGDVKEFAACVQQLRNLQHIYTVLLRDLRATLSPPSPSPSSPRKPRRGTLSSLASPGLSPTKSPRKFSFAAPPVPDPLAKLDATYGVWWECAELLISLGGREEEYAEEHSEAGRTRGRRPRAVTLGSGSDVSAPSAGPPPASPQRSQWRATTGRAGPRDLTPRQLALLRGMLRAETGTGWDPHTAMGRMREHGNVSVREKARGAGLGIRDLWRGLRRGGGAEGGRPSSSGDSSASEAGAFGTPSPSPAHTKRTLTAATYTTVLSRRKQPTRRPSLAGIFGLGQRTSSAPGPTPAEHTDASSDWDAAEHPITGTIRGTIRKRTSKAKDAPVRESSSSPQKLASNPRPFIAISPSTSTSDSPKRRRIFSTTTRPEALSRDLALSPQNIRPLLGHARDIGTRLNECIGEVRELMGGAAAP